MNDWPEGWTADSRDRYGRGSRASDPEPHRVMPVVGGGGVPPQRSQGYDDDRGPYDDGYNQGQVYRSGGGDPNGPYGGDDGGDRRASGYGKPPPNWRKRIKIGAIVALVILIVVPVATYFWADSKLRREVDLSKVEDRPGDTGGTNYLIVGSDSREGLSKERQDELHTGSVEGKRTDSMMILHTGDNGNTMVSLPRDWMVTIPSFTGSETGNRIPEQTQKINAAYAIEGPELLVRTVEYNTGLKIDHYAEIGFGGFANIVDELGGVEMCFDEAVKDKNSGADFEKGCQDLNGAEALAFVRNRYALPGGDLDRTKNQQKLLSKLASESAKITTVMNPFKLYPTMGAGLDSLIVDKDMSLFNVLQMFWAMKGVSGGDGKSMNLPVVSGGTDPRLGSVQKWDEPKARQLFEQLKNDDKVTVSAD